MTEKETTTTASAGVSKSKSLKRGVVISDKLDKTIVVKVNTFKEHPKYKKRYMSSKKYKVHDEKNQFKVGDKVSFRSCRPISRDKKWIVMDK